LSENGSNSVDNTVIEDYDTARVRSVIQAVRDIRFGAVDLVIHDGRVVQIERREKLRLGDGHRRPDNRERNNQSGPRADRISGSFEAREAKEKR
jgi:hypothetical protein